jgi:hypothetical protein
MPAASRLVSTLGLHKKQSVGKSADKAGKSARATAASGRSFK